MPKTNAVLQTLSLTDLTKVFNDIPNVKQIKKFSCSKVEAIAKIEAARAANAPKKSVKAVKANGEKATRGQGIGARTVELLKSGKSIKEAFVALQEEFGETVSLNSLYWYSSKVKRGEL